jgi:hypothetical protein
VINSFTATADISLDEALSLILLFVRFTLRPFSGGS